jgi:IS605 OrfB family transposase
MILTIKIKHCADLNSELEKAKRVALYALKTRSRSSKDVNHIGLKSAISNQILKKYSSNKKLKTVNRVKLTLPSQSINIDKINKNLVIPCLNMTLPMDFFRYKFEKINQVELDKEYAYVTGTIKEPELIKQNKYIGVDLNTTGHCAVIGIPHTGKVIKLGKKALYIHTKYKNIRKKFQSQKKWRKLNQIKRRESNIVRDLNHKISKKIVLTAKENNCSIKLENLKGIRNNKKQAQSFKYSLSSWSYNQLRSFIEYKAKKFGVVVGLVAPAYTSKTCSVCGTIGLRKDKSFMCPSCGHVDHADANAAFNIAAWALQDPLDTDRDVSKGNTDVPQCRVAISCREAA